MGRLKIKLLAIQFLVSLVVGYVGFRITQPRLVEALLQTSETENSNLTAEVTKNSDNYSQIQITKDGQATLITDENTTHSSLVLGDQYLVWMEEDETGWNIMSYDRLTEQTLQLTHVFHHSTPQTWSKYVTWISHENNQWSVTLFDGIKTLNLVQAEKAVQDLGITPLGIVFTQMSDDKKGWKLFLYRFSNQKLEELDADNLVGDVKVINQYEGSRVAWKTQAGQPKYLQLIPFKMPPIKAPVVVQPEDGAEDESSESNEIETEATASAQPTEIHEDEINTASSSTQSEIPSTATQSSLPASE